MTPREIILANLEHTGAPRAGLTFDRDRMNDMIGAGLGASVGYQPKRWVEGNREYYDDEWGNIWVRMAEGCQGGEIHEPAIKDWSQLDRLRVPDFDAPRRYDGMREAFAQANGRFKLASLPGWVFATSRYLRKMEIYLADLVESPDEVNQLHGIVTDVLVKVIRRCAEAGGEGVIFCEDLGIQDRPLMSPSMWRRFFKSHYLRLTGAAHEAGMKVFMHSCGYNWALIDDLVESGIDCFQFDQPAAYDLPALARKLKQHRVALWSPVDIQKIMPTGDRELIETSAREMCRIFEGGLICKNYGDLRGIGVQPEWDQWAYEEILRFFGVAPPGAVARPQAACASTSCSK